MSSSTITLYIDTTSSNLYTGIVKNQDLLIQVQENLGKDLSTYALSKIEEMFRKINLQPIDIDQLIVVNGPGSFTGIRIGITIAKTYAWAMNKKIKTISSLEAMAISTETTTLKVPIIDARRGYVFAGIYDQDNTNILENCYIKLDDLIEKVNSLNKEYQIISNENFNLKKQIYTPDILKIVTACENRESINPHAVNPEYLKRTEAEETKGIEAE